jgi:uncharacterized caspase-like protein
MLDKNIRKTALVIGQSNYVYYDTLSSSFLDADGMAEVLVKSGFSVSKHYDLDQGSMIEHIDEWLANLCQYDVALFYYSGHGVEVDSLDYLVPVDGKFYTNTDIRCQAYSIYELIGRLDAEKQLTKIVLVDACRGKLDASRTSVSENVPSSMKTEDLFVGFAASPGDVVFSGPKDSLSFYTNSIIRNLGRDITFSELFAKVENEVRSATEQKQVPQKSSTLVADIFPGQSSADE